MKRILLASFILSLGFVIPAYSKDTGSSAGLLLKQITSVRAEGMGGAQTAVTTDEAGAIGWNPAALNQGQYPDLSAVYYRGLADDSYGALNYDMAMNPDLACGAGVLFYDAGSFDLNSDAGETSTVSAERDFLVSLTGAYRMHFLGTNLAAGANLKVLQSTLLAKYSALAAAVDLGVQAQFTGWLSNLQAGLAIKNLGTPIKYLDNTDPLPSYSLLGLAYNVHQDKTFAVLVAGDAQYDLENTWRENVGVEIKIVDFVAVRGGYQINSAIESFTLGIGFNFENFQLDYAFSPTQALNATHIASLKYTFGPLAKPEAPHEAEAGEAPVVIPENVEKQNGGPVQKIQVGVLEIHKAGGRASEVIMSGGSEQQIKVGYEGALVDSSGHPVAALVVRQVEPKLSLADIIGLSREIDNNVTAIIEIPVKK
jgi:hypothetical protein